MRTMRKTTMAVAVSLALVSNMAFVYAENTSTNVEAFCTSDSCRTNRSLILSGAGLVLDKMYDTKELDNEIKLIEQKNKQIENTVQKLLDKNSEIEQKIQKLEQSKAKAQGKANNAKNRKDRITNNRKVQNIQQQINKLKKEQNQFKKQYNAWNDALNKMKKSTSELKDTMSKLKKGTKNFAKQYAKNSDKANALKEIRQTNSLISLKLNVIFGAIDGALQVNDLRKDAQELVASYPELSDLLTISSKDYWGTFVDSFTQLPAIAGLSASGAAVGASFISTSSLFSKILKGASKGLGKIAGVLSVFIPQGGMIQDPHDPMPDPENKSEFLSWFATMSEFSENYLNYIDEASKQGIRLNIPMGILQYWQILDTAYPDPNMAWIHYWQFDKNGKAIWIGEKAYDTNNILMLNLVSNNTQGSTSHFSTASTTVDINKLNNQNYRKTVQENPFYTRGTVPIQAPVDIVLNWGNHPADLDSHLTGPMNGDSNQRFHVWFENQGSLNNAPNVLLYRDDVDHRAGGANLPEQTRINVTPNGRYEFYVHDFTNRDKPNSKALSQSNAVVTIHTAGNRELPEGHNLGKQVAYFEVPKDKAGTVWHTFEIDTTRNTIKPIEKIHPNTSVIK